MAVEPQGSGGTGGPGGVHFIGSEPSLLVQSGTKAVDATTVYAEDTIYGISFQVTIPQTEFLGQGPLSTAELYASYIQQVAALPAAVAVYYGQDVNAAGNLVDALFVVVGDPTQQFTTTVSVPIVSSNTPAAFAKIAVATTVVTNLAAGA